MDYKTIKSSWMNPATANKRTSDGDAPKVTPKKKRIIQGEKGIGRFAILKLGRKIKITTRPEQSPVEYIIDYDLSKYDDDFLTEDGKNKELFIDDIVIPVSDRIPEYFKNRQIIVNSRKYDSDNDHGTRIQISSLKGEWSSSMIKEVNDESQKLESIFEQISHRKDPNRIEIGFELNNDRLQYANNAVDALSRLMEESAALRITNGCYHEKDALFQFIMNGEQYSIPISSPYISGLKIFREHFVEGKDLFGEPIIRESSCGDFRFNFFVFDLAADKESDCYLDKEDKEIIRCHRIYLYRDKIRVAPAMNHSNTLLN